jgi:hypothetical protein
MSTGTVVSLFLSALALLISAATLYLTLIRKKAALVGCLRAMTTQVSVEDGDWVLEFALANTGDVELLVSEVDLDTPTDNLVPEISSDALPLVLEPGRVRSLTLELPHRFCWRVSNSRDSLTFSFHVFSSRGVSYFPRTTVVLAEAAVETRGTSWVPFTLGRAVR